jgi:trigger factor
VKVSAQEVEQRQMVLEIEVEDERVEQAYDQAYRRIVNRMNVPGFRRGKAPRPLVERMVGRESILEDAVEHLVPRVYEEAIKEQQIEVAGQPSLEVTSTEPLQFKATVPLKPVVQLGEYRSIEIPAEPVTIDEAEIDAVVENLRDANATWVPVERASAIGDRVGIDLKATRGGRVLTDAKDAEFVLNPDGTEPLPGFSQQLVGMEAEQQREFSLSSGEGDQDEPRLQTDCEVTVHWVKEKQLPEVDDDFARTVGQKDSVEELRQDIGDRIQRQKELQARSKHEDAIAQAAVDQARVSVPPQMITRHAQDQLETLARRLDNQGISVQQYLQFTGKSEDEFKAEMLADAETSLKRALVLGAVAEAEGLSVSDDDVRSEIELAAQGASDPRKATRDALARPEVRERIASMLRSRKGLKRLVEIAGGTPSESTSAEASTMSGEPHE